MVIVRGWVLIKIYLNIKKVLIILYYFVGLYMKIFFKNKNIIYNKESVWFFDIIMYNVYNLYLKKVCFW